MYGLYFITLQRSGTRPVTKPLRSIRPEHRGTFHTQFWLGTICPSTHPSICPSMYILVSFCGRLQLLRGHLRGRGNGIAIGISHIPMVSARLFPRSDNRVRAGRIVFMTLCPKQILRLGFLFRPNFGIFKGGGVQPKKSVEFLGANGWTGPWPLELYPEMFAPMVPKLILDIFCVPCTPGGCALLWDWQFLPKNVWPQEISPG